MLAGTVLGIRIKDSKSIEESNKTRIASKASPSE
jgi:hypothetical protein